MPLSGWGHQCLAQVVVRRMVGDEAARARGRSEEPADEEKPVVAKESPMLSYPTERLVAVVPRPEQVEKAVAGLRAAGIDDDRIAVRCCEQEAGRFDPTNDDVSGLTGIVRVVQRVLGDETEKLQRLDAALAAGHYVLEIDPGPGGDAPDADLRELGRLLREAGAREVSYYGEWAIEDLDPVT